MIQQFLNNGKVSVASKGNVEWSTATSGRNGVDTLTVFEQDLKGFITPHAGPMGNT